MNELLLALALCVQVGYPQKIEKCNHPKDAKVCFWKKEEQRIYSETCKECQDDIAKKRCLICNVDYHVSSLDISEMRVDKKQPDYMILGWIYGDKSLFTGWIPKNYKDILK